MILRLLLLVLFVITPLYVQAYDTKPQTNKSVVTDRLPTLKEFIHSKHHIRNVAQTIRDMDAWIRKNMW